MSGTEPVEHVEESAAVDGTVCLTAHREHPDEQRRDVRCAAPTKNRNVEYDAFDDAYASFLLDEVLPLVRTRAALTAAWCRPDGFGRVISFNPSFAQMPGGNPYPALLATGPRRETRVFLHAAHRDLHWNEPEWNWFAESLETAAALARAQYDVRLVVGDGAHAPNHGGVLLPDALRWLWHRPSE